MSASRRPTSTRLNGFLWQLGMFMASSNSMGFIAETEGSSEGGTGTIHCRCWGFESRGERTLCFCRDFHSSFLDLLWNILPLQCCGLSLCVTLSCHYVRTLQEARMCRHFFKPDLDFWVCFFIIGSVVTVLF